jgi:hypothetical protein
MEKLISIRKIERIGNVGYLEIRDSFRPRWEERLRRSDDPACPRTR